MNLVKFKDLTLRLSLTVGQLNPAGTVWLQVTHAYEYSLKASGRRASVRENNGRQSVYGYDALQRMESETIGLTARQRATVSRGKGNSGFFEQAVDMQEELSHGGHHDPFVRFPPGLEAFDVHTDHRVVPRS